MTCPGREGTSTTRTCLQNRLQISFFLLLWGVGSALGNSTPRKFFYTHLLYEGVSRGALFFSGGSYARNGTFAGAKEICLFCVCVCVCVCVCSDPTFFINSMKRGREDGLEQEIESIKGEIEVLKVEKAEWKAKMDAAEGAGDKGEAVEHLRQLASVQQQLASVQQRLTLKEAAS